MCCHSPTLDYRSPGGQARRHGRSDKEVIPESKGKLDRDAQARSTTDVKVGQGMPAPREHFPIRHAAATRAIGPLSVALPLGFLVSTGTLLKRRWRPRECPTA